MDVSIATARSLKKKKQQVQADQDLLNDRWTNVLAAEEYGLEHPTRSYPKCKLRESRTKGSSGVRPIILWDGLMGYEDMKAEDYTCVRIGLSLAWKELGDRL